MEKNWGIHLIKSEVESGLYKASYFVERSFGNLICLTPPEVISDNNHEIINFITQKGGIAYQIPSSNSMPNHSQKILYERFGAPYLYSRDSQELRDLGKQNHDFRYILYGTEFFDHRVEFGNILGNEVILIDKGSIPFIFFPNPFFYDRGNIRLGINGEAIKKLEVKDNTYVKTLDNAKFLFHYYRGVNWCDGGNYVK